MSSYPTAPQPWSNGPTPAGEPPLDQPHYGIGFVPAIRRGFRKYATFGGRAGRGEFWWWQLFVSAVYLVLLLLAGIGGAVTSPNGGDDPGPLLWPFAVLLLLFLLGVFVPTIAVTVRRLHDAGYSGWLYLLVLIPYVGGIPVLILCLLRSSTAGVRFDKNAAYAVPGAAYPPQPPYGPPAPDTQYNTWTSRPGEGPR
jgi:uncharacterized membrane protein YhaH (DUF805 family)